MKSLLTKREQIMGKMREDKLLRQHKSAAAGRHLRGRWDFPTDRVVMADGGMDQPQGVHGTPLLIGGGNAPGRGRQIRREQFQGLLDVACSANVKPSLALFLPFNSNYPASSWNILPKRHEEDKGKLHPQAPIDANKCR